MTAHQPVTGPTVRDRFTAAVARFGAPASTLTDNEMVFTTRFAGGKGGRNALEAELRRRHVEQKNSRPNKPATCGKVERFQQTPWGARSRVSCCVLVLVDQPTEDVAPAQPARDRSAPALLQLL